MLERVCRIIMQKFVFSPAAVFVRTILIADDSAFIRRVLEEMMHDDTLYQLIVAKNGAEALEIASIIKPHLFLFDYQMSDMNGLQLYDTLHARKGLRNIPAILMSTELPRVEIERRNILGVEKPFHPNVLLRMVEGVIQSTQIEPSSNSHGTTNAILSLAL